MALKFVSTLVLLILFFVCPSWSITGNPIKENIHGSATGLPIVISDEVPGWTRCASYSLSFKTNLDKEISLFSEKEVHLPEWGMSFDFDGLYIYEPTTDGDSEYYSVTKVKNVKRSSVNCFEVVFAKPVTEICEEYKTVKTLKKLFSPNHVIVKNPRKIEKALNKLPVALVGCFQNKDHNIQLELKK